MVKEPMEIRQGNWLIKLNIDDGARLEDLLGDSALLSADHSGLDPERGFDPAGFSVVKAAVRNKRILSEDGADGPLRYLKILSDIPWRKSLRDGVASQGYRSPTSREWQALLRLEQLGICAPRPLVVAEEIRWGLVRRAILLTEALPAAETLEELLLSGMDSKRQALVAAAVAEVLSRMHEGGINHRDFYLGHLRVEASNRIQVLDLDRADLRSRVARRWRIKDLAALDFSTPSRCLGSFERLRFLSRYAAATGLSARDLAPGIQAKSALILAHAQRKIARGDSNIHINQ